ncbi:serine/threonine protein kinase [Minicystis rosea]|nr:serine/threonine protein kinase [Minicystis rosea]
MKSRGLAHGSPALAGFAEGDPLAPIGRASRLASPPDAEIWRLARADEATAKRLLDLGAAGVGGFIAGGIDGDDVWLARRASGTTLHDALRARKGAWPWRDAVGLVATLARALAACERAALFPGPLTPETVIVRDGHAILPAAGLVGALAGAPEAAPRRADTASPLWIPPAQLDGAAWDGAANRHALGLLLYRLLSGEHPFAGGGLRHALDEAARRAPPPFRDAVAAALPAGLQSLTLRMLDPDDGVRPGGAAEIAEALAGFAQASAGTVREISSGIAPAPTIPSGGAIGQGRAHGKFVGAQTISDDARSAEDGAAPKPRAIAKAAASSPSVPTAGKRAVAPAKAAPRWPLVAGAAVAIGALAVAAGSSPPQAAPASSATSLVAPAPPLTQARTSASDCAACHPRQAAEWRRSVMAHSVKSPLFNALESLIEEQVGRDRDCPNGAGILRKANASTACRDRASGTPVTGSGGEHWCVNCHVPAEKLDTPMPAWDGRSGGDPKSRFPVRDLIGERALEGISCGFCHEVHGPVAARGRGGYEGNATWTSFVTGAVFAARPEDGRGLVGIGNSGYDLRPEDFLVGRQSGRELLAGAHLPTPRASRAYLRSSEFCGSCHDVRLFGTDTVGVARGEHFKRLRNAYSEWAAWSQAETRAGRTPASCQDCHMSAFPGVCEPDPSGSASDPECPKGHRFVSRAPGALPKGRVAESSGSRVAVTTHYFSGVDVPLGRDYPSSLVDEPTVDLHGIPLSARRRRDALLRRTFRFALGTARRGGNGLEIPLEIENVGAGHRVPAGFSQEREIWVHLVVRDGDGRALYEVGRVDRPDEDLRDKVFIRVSTRGDEDRAGRPVGLFGADVRDGPDVGTWQPPPALGGTSFRGRGLVNFQNGFLRCVRCIGTVAADGHCEPGPGQSDTRAARFVDGDYDIDTGACRSNLSGANALFETYFPVGALDASRGLVKGPDAIIDTRSLPPNVPIRYTYDLSTSGRRGPFKVEARLLFRAFPPFLIKAFASYEREQSSRGLRPSGPLVTEEALGRLEVVEVARAETEIR